METIYTKLRTNCNVNAHTGSKGIAAKIDTFFQFLRYKGNADNYRIESVRKLEHKFTKN